MLRSNLFFSQAAYRQRVTSPVEFAVGIVRSLESLIATAPLAHDLANLGQRLYYPPTPAGFPSGRYWLSDAAFAARNNLAVAMLQGSGPYKDKLDPWAVANSHQYATVDAAAQFVLDLFLQGDIEKRAAGAMLEEARNAGTAGREEPAAVLRRFTHSVVTRAEFNLT